MGKERIKKVGRNFVRLNQIEAPHLSDKVLIVDNGYVSYRHLELAIENILMGVDRRNVSVITFEYRRDFIVNRFGDINIIMPQRRRIRRYEIAHLMFNCRKMHFKQVVILSLDITPIVVSLFFMKCNLILYNRWNQWWQLKLINLKDVSFIIFRFFMNIFIFVYLFAIVSLIFIRRIFSLIYFKCIWIKDDNVAVE